MNKDVIDYMIDVVSTMEDEDIINFVEEYQDELSNELISYLISMIDDNEVLSNYIKYVSDNIDVILSKWNDCSTFELSYDMEEDNNSFGLRYYVVDNEFDLGLYEEESFCQKINNTSIINNLINHLMTAIGKFEDDFDKYNLLTLFFKNIKPSIISFVGEENFDNGCKNFYFEQLCGILSKMHDVDIMLLISDYKDYLDKDEMRLLIQFIDSEKLRDYIIDDYNLDDYSLFFDCTVENEDKLEEKVLEYLKYLKIVCCDYGNSLSVKSKNCISELLNNIISICHYLDDNKFVKDIFLEVYDICGVYFPGMMLNFDDDSKIKAFYEYDMIGAVGYVELLASISNDKKFREIYDNLSNGFLDGGERVNDDDKIKLITFRKDKQMAYEMLSNKYDEFKRIKNADERISLIELVSDMISIFDKEEQIEIYNWFADIGLFEERAILVCSIKDIEFKREFLQKLRAKENDELSSCVKSRKLYS